MGVREEMQKVMRESLADEAAHHNWTYHAVRPLYVPSKPYVNGKHYVSDCSKGSQFIAHWGGAPDPFGMHFGPYGNSSTATAHLEHLAHPSELKVGDYVTMGYLGSEHMTTVLEAGEDPLLWSDGHQGAPNSYRASQDRRQKYYLRNPVHDEPETPAEILRAKEGFFAWYHWSTGTGGWHRYGKRNKKVRPHVPRRIPLRWFKHRARLIMLKRKRRANTGSVKPVS